MSPRPNHGLHGYQMSPMTNLVAMQTMIRTWTLKVTLLIVAAILTATPPTLMALITTMEMNTSTATNGIHTRSMFTIMTGHILHDRAVHLFCCKLYLLTLYTMRILYKTHCRIF